MERNIILHLNSNPTKIVRLLYDWTLEYGANCLRLHNNVINEKKKKMFQT